MILETDVFMNENILHTNEIFSKKEMRNLFEIFLYVVQKRISLHTFIDHLTMIQRIKKFEKVQWRANNLSSFNEEHSIFTDKFSFYTKGLLTRIFNED